MSWWVGRVEGSQKHGANKVAGMTGRGLPEEAALAYEGREPLPAPEGF